MSSPSLHAVLGASSAKRWLTCQPSARLHERLTNRFGSQSSPFAQYGTKAHALSEIKVRKAIWEAEKMTTEKSGSMSATEKESFQGINPFRYEALRTELGEIPQDMDQLSDSYCDVIMMKFHQAREADPQAQILLEQRLDYSKWVPSGFGTGDCVIVSDNLLEVCDLKAGKGIPVDAVGNPQLRLYALGAYARFGCLYEFKNIRYTIIQPRLDSVSEETISVDDLLQWADDHVVEAAQNAWLGKGEFIPGEHCRFCAAKAICSARVAEAMKMFQYGLESPGLLPDEQIPQILKVLDAAEDWIKDIRAYAENQALHGQVWPGYKLVHGKKPNRQWTNPEEVEAQLLRAGYSVEQFRESRLKPVGSVEKIIGAKAFKALLDGLVSQGEGKLTLVPEDDKRVAYASADADFSDLI